MDEQHLPFWQQVNQVLSGYWQGFIEILPRIVFALVLLIFIFFIAGTISRLLKRKLATRAHDPLFSGFLVKMAKVVLIICGIILSLHVLGLSGIAGGLLAGAGLSAFIIGFAFKDIAENFLAGIILAFNRPFALNDTVQIKEYAGHVKALNFRTTLIKTFDEKDVFIPNAVVLKEIVTNLTRDGWIRLDFLVGIAYEDDIAAASSLIIETIEKCEEVNTSQKPFTVVEELAVNTVNLRIFFWTDTDDYKRGVLTIKSAIMQKVKEALANNGFTLPANIVEMKLYDKRTSLPVEMVQRLK